MSTISNQRGIALLMVMASVTLLAFVLADFTFEAQLNKIKSYHLQDRVQSRYNAESGLQLALARLQIYQAALNHLEKNPSRKEAIPMNLLNQIWNLPFMYPIPMVENMDIIQRNAIQEFLDSVMLNGELMVTIQNASGLINLNLLRVSGIKNIKQYIDKVNNKPEAKEEDSEENDEDPFPAEEEGEEDPLKKYQTDPQELKESTLLVENKLKALLSTALERKVENDELFRYRYGNTDVDLLIKSIKYYVNDLNSLDDPDISQIAQSFEEAGIRPKHAPMSSLSELYLIPGWDDQLVELIINEITVHGVMSIDLNNITGSTLKLLFDEITDQQIDDFFKRKNDPDLPLFFNGPDQFKKYFVDEGIFAPEYMDERFAEFSRAGITFGPSPSLFKVLSQGSYGNSKYTVNAWVTIPIKPPPPPVTSPVVPPPGQPTSPPPPSNPGGGNDTKKPAANPVEYLAPRVVELFSS